MKYITYADISNISNFNYDFSGFSTDRIDYIKSINDAKRKAQSYYVWKLLLQALSKLSIQYDSNCFVKNENGSWGYIDNSFFFSLSHSDNIVCVAISDNPVSIDVEKYDKKIIKATNLLIKKFPDEIDSKSPSENERLEYFTKKWTQFECIKKGSNLSNFTSYDLFDNHYNKYCVTVACDKIGDFDTNKIVKEYI